MRDRWGLNERMFGFYYPIIMGVSELAGQRKTRRALLAGARGRTLEIGPGNGYNLPHYTSAVSELVLAEPSPHLSRRLRDRLASSPPPVGSWELAGTGAEELPFPDESFDTVVGTYVHCTIPDPNRALDEIRRVLRPGGRYLFLEHVRAADGTVTGVMQDVFAPVNRYFGAGCNPNRRTERTLRDSGLLVERLEHGTMPLAIPTLRPTILGTARRDDDAGHVVSAGREIAAGAERIFELIADPARQPAWDGNENLADAPAGQRVRGTGEMFTMTLTMGSVRENHVVEFDECRRIAWRPAEPGQEPPGHLWRWELDPINETRTLVTHTYDWTRLTDPGRFERARATTADQLRASLDRLAELAESQAGR